MPFDKLLLSLLIVLPALFELCLSCLDDVEKGFENEL